MKMEYEFLVAKDVSKVINKYFHIELSVEEQCYLAIHILGKKAIQLVQSKAVSMIN